MPDFLTAPFGDLTSDPLDVFARLSVALILGGVVAWVYRGTRAPDAVAPSFPGTLVLLAVLIAMVTQVIGDNVARAFSLVGALAIVRFRTVVRDTQDTAYVIFAVVVGMAVGAADLAVAVIGLFVVSVGAFIMRSGRVSPAQATGETKPARLRLRVALGLDLESLLGTTLDAHSAKRRLVSVGTARQGTMVDAEYEVDVGTSAPDALVAALNRLDGVQNVRFDRRESTDEAV